MPAPKQPRVPAQIWLLLKIAYLNGEGSVEQLARKFGINPTTAVDKCSRQKWNVERNEKLQENTKQSLTLLNSSTRAKALQWLSEQHQHLTQLTQLWQHQSVTVETAQDIKNYVTAYESLVRVGKSIYGLDQPNSDSQSNSIELKSMEELSKALENVKPEIKQAVEQSIPAPTDQP